MRTKKSQITTFLIVGLLLVAGIVMIFVLNDPNKSSAGAKETSNMVNYVESCLKDTTEKGLTKLEAENGLVHPAVFDAPQAGIEYCSDHKLTQKTADVLQTELNAYVQDNLNDCIQDFQPMQVEAEITHKDPVALTSFNERTVSVKITYEVTMKIGQKIYVQDSFRADIPSRITSTLDSAQKICSAYNGYIRIVSAQKPQTNVYILPYN